MSFQESARDKVLPLDINAPQRGLKSPSERGRQFALLAFSHTVIEHRLYLAMWTALGAEGAVTGVFGKRRLLSLTGLTSYGSVRRGCAGLIRKLSVEQTGTGSGGRKYRIYAPSEIFARRQEAGVEPYPKQLRVYAEDEVFLPVLEDLAARWDLSRRESMVALYCAGGLSNADIGDRLDISDKTVKFHLRHIFLKCSIKRRSELLGRLLAGSANRNRSAWAAV